MNKNHHIIVGLSGGLGNQLFQYAAGLSLSIKLQIPLKLDLTWFQGRVERQFALDPFNIQANKIQKKTYFPKIIQATYSRISRRFAKKVMNISVFREPHYQYVDSFNLITQPVYLDGYWQSEKYFRGNRENILKEFSLKNELPKNCLEILAEIEKCDAICVHVRRGDYVTNPKAALVHGLCSSNYYVESVLEISRNLKNPRCFIFTDDHKWVSSNLNFPCPATLVDLNGSQKSHLDLVLMSNCKYFVISNSSFSWWAAWLCNKSGKRIIAPQRWFLNSKIDTRDLLPTDWERR